MPVSLVLRFLSTMQKKLLQDHGKRAHIIIKYFQHGTLSLSLLPDHVYDNAFNNALVSYDTISFFSK